MEIVIDPSAFVIQNAGQRDIVQRLINQVQHSVRFYSNPAQIVRARQIAPLQQIRENVQKILNESGNGQSASSSGNDLLFARELQSWFKGQCFQWTNEPPCKSCQAKGQPCGTRAIGMAQPNMFEMQGLAGRVEVYQCNNCQQQIRFPRYNDPMVLLSQTRCGRCGEWANSFVMLASAVLGAQNVRYVLDWSDHVWAEYYDSTSERKRWLHFDPCENAVDSPLMYEQGWGKQLTYIFAINHEQVVDVTPRYSRKWHEVLQRRRAMGVTEEWLEQTLAALNYQLQVFMTPDAADRVNKRLAEEKIELESYKTASEKDRVLKAEEEQGRISGSAEWKASRGEDGKSMIEQAQALEKEYTIPQDLQDIVNTKVSDTLVVVGTKQFSQARLALNGVAIVQQEGSLRLTQAQQSLAGSAWIQVPRDALVDAFEAEFSFVIPSPAGADGFALVLQQSPAGATAIGGSGDQLGYTGISHSIAIEFDTWKGQDEPDDNHISVQTRYAEPNSSKQAFSLGCTKYLPFKISDGQIHNVKIVYVQKNLFITADDRPVLRCLVDLERVLCRGAYAPTFIGFTASTGGVTQIHEVLSLSLKSVKQSCFSVREPIVFTAINVQGILKEFIKLQQRVGFGMDDLKVLSQIVQKKEGQPITDQEKSIIKNALLTWPVDALFPMLDALRNVVLFSAGAIFLQHDNSILDSLIAIIKKDPTSFANKLMFLRLLSNLFQQQSGRALALERAPELLDMLMGELRVDITKDKPAVKVAFASLLVNYAQALRATRGDSLSGEDEVATQLVSAIVATTNEQLADCANALTDDNADVLSKLITSLGVLASANASLHNLVQSMGLELVQCTSVRSKLPSSCIRLAACVDELLALLHM